MTLPRNAPQMIGPREAKAIKTLLSAKTVAREVEDFRHQLTNPHLERAKAARCAAEMNDALARLCNLISLALAEINEIAGEQFRLRFDLLLDEVRGRLLQMNFHEMIKRLEDIRDQARQALQHHDYRLGYAARLERAYADVLDHLIAMGATEELGLDPRFLTDVIDTVKALSEIEIKVFKLIDFDALPPAVLPE